MDEKTRSDSFMVGAILALVAIFAFVVIAGIIGACAFVVSLSGDFHDVLYPVAGVLVLLFLIAAFSNGITMVQSLADWWMQRRMTWDVHSVTITKAQLDLSLVQPDVNGLLPLPRYQLENGQISQSVLLLAAQHVANRQPVQPVPNSISYAPHLINRNEGVKVAEGIPLPAPSILTPQTFIELFRGGKLPSDRFFMGYDLETGEPIMATWRDLYSALIGGQSGSGKSTLIRSILAQSALQGGQFVVIDPHYSAGDESLGQSLSPLSSRFACEVADNESKMVDALHYVRDVGVRRLAGKDTDKTPLILIVDETTALLSRSGVAEELLSVLGMIAQETRKVGVYAMCIGQQFKSDIMDTSVRNSFVSYVSCRARKDVARVMSGDNDFATIAGSLVTGQAVWMAPSGDVRKLSVPNTTADMIAEVAKSLEVDTARAKKGQNRAPDAPLVCEPLPLPLPSPLPDPLPAWNVAPADAKEVRAVQLFLSGAKKAQIIAEVFGIEDKGGRNWQKASEEIDEYLRKRMQGQ